MLGQVDDRTPPWTGEMVQEVSITDDKHRMCRQGVGVAAKEARTLQDGKFKCPGGRKTRIVEYGYFSRMNQDTLTDEAGSVKG